MKIKSSYIAIISLLFGVAVICKPLFACPLIDGMVDYNCNQKHKIVIAGDSVVQGLNDNPNGGYPRRLNSSLQESNIVNNGGFGYTARDLLNRYRSGNFLQRTLNADVVIIDVGRNDCRDNLPATTTIKIIKQLVRFIRKRVRRSSGIAPYVIVSTQIPNRSDRRSCIARLNRELRRHRSRKLPVKLRFDKMSASVLSGDGLHPDSQGYARIAEKTEKFLRGKGNNLLMKERKDQDQDNIYDLFETNVYGTDPSNPDTDGDGATDGDEVFIAGTDPLSPTSIFD